jgi:hypothetical protein
MHRSQAKAAACELGREEGIEDTRHGGFIHSRAVIPDFQENMGTGLDIEDSGVLGGDLRRDSVSTSRNFNPPVRLGRYRFARVDDQIHQDLLDPVGVGFDERQVLREVEFKAHPLGNGGRKELCRLRHKVGENEPLCDELALAGICQ